MESCTTSRTEVLKLYQDVRKQTQFLCDPLEVEDFVVQPIVDVSPLKWHLGHTTWFFEAFVLMPYLEKYKVFNGRYSFLFNSYYISAGDRWSRANRGQLTRPTVQEVFEYRSYVDESMEELLSSEVLELELVKLVETGCNHEQQHQELFLYDIKRILGDNPLFPVYRPSECQTVSPTQEEKVWMSVAEGIYQVGFEGEGFHFDNEEGRHNVFLHQFSIESGLVTNKEYLEFIEDGGYSNHLLWLSEAWEWVNSNHIQSPRYWHMNDGGEWAHYALSGLESMPWDDPVAHVSYYEADAFARWKNCRLPTEFEWEVACGKFAEQIPENANFVENKAFRPVQTGSSDFYGNLWEWTASPYTAYPYFRIADGALGEYNGKFMINQMVLRGGSFATPKNHIRKTYRNFFHPHLRWLFSGIRLAKHD